LKQKRGILPFEIFSKVFRQISDRTLIVLLFNWGEPLLNPNLFAMIEEVSAASCLSVLHSNFSVPQVAPIRKLAESNLTSLVLSIDGASKQSYSIYRKGGDFDLVLNNVELFLRQRKKLRKRIPEVTWKFIVHKHNENELEKAARIAKGIGVDFISFTPIYLGDFRPGTTDNTFDERLAREWLPVFHKEFIFDSNKEILYDQPCPHLWTSPVVNVDGTVFPCCFVNDSTFMFGDLTSQSFFEVWNNSLFQYSRSLFSKSDYDGPKVNSVCDHCRIYNKIKQ
jgi:radical SAM protein with 4Fe4S-binding SPASM domain